LIFMMKIAWKRAEYEGIAASDECRCWRPLKMRF
jgi:hypothetical protein